MGGNEKSRPNNINEQAIIQQAEQFLLKNKICQSNKDQYFNTFRIIIAKIKIYGHQHLIKHIEGRDRQKSIKFLHDWKSISFQTLDLLFQNLVRKKIQKQDQPISYDSVNYHTKPKKNSNSDNSQLVMIGQQLMKNKKVGVLIFVGSSVSRLETSFVKQFYKRIPQEKCIFQIIMQKLKNIGQQYAFPETYIFYNNSNYIKISQYLKDFHFASQVHTIVQNTQPILNLNGHICLKSKDYGNIIEVPNGSGGFYQSFYRGTNILQKLSLSEIQYVCCIDCQNILEQVIDPYMLGFLDKNQDNLDLLYKCTYTENEKEKQFKRIIRQNGVSKVDNDAIKLKFQTRHESYDKLLTSPIWCNSLVFHTKNVMKVLKNISIFPKTFSVKFKQNTYWSPIDEKVHAAEYCYVFERELSDLFVNSLFRSQAIMVEREDEFLPVLTLEDQYSWKDAYEEYENRKKKKDEPEIQQDPMKSLVTMINQFE